MDKELNNIMKNKEKEYKDIEEYFYIPKTCKKCGKIKSKNIVYSYKNNLYKYGSK